MEARELTTHQAGMLAVDSASQSGDPDSDGRGLGSSRLPRPLSNRSRISALGSSISRRKFPSSPQTAASAAVFAIVIRLGWMEASTPALPPKHCWPQVGLAEADASVLLHRR